MEKKKERRKEGKANMIGENINSHQLSSIPISRSKCISFDIEKIHGEQIEKCISIEIILMVQGVSRNLEKYIIQFHH